MCLWGGVSKLITCSAFSALMIFYVILVKILNILGFSLTFISLFLYFVLGLIANLVPLFVSDFESGSFII